jgi:amino acid adenylation domain-containing protein
MRGSVSLGESIVITNRLEAITTRITRRATEDPSHLAVVDAARSLSYRELDQSSDLLAARLLGAGARRGQTVGLCLERSTQFVAAALAVLKTGATYVPIDPSLPFARVRAMLEDADALAVLTVGRRAQELPAGPWRVLDVDDDRGEWVDPRQNIEITADDLAYIIYTSGSTGAPKGVEITHGSLCNLIDWHESAFRVRASDRASQVASVGFDAAVWEIWPALASGATLVIADELTRRSAQALHDWILQEKITISFVPTALAEQLMRTSWPGETALRVLLTGGDVLRQRPSPDVPFVVVNNYGPTECTVVATSGIVTPSKNGSRPPSIGRPIANAYALILDDDLQPVPTGEPGELCIAGALLGRGYHKHPELTASQFVTYTSVTGEPVRIYRTRDRAKMLPNGDVEFLGRLDSQVKIRGHRIELGEITTTLNRIDGVSASVVAVREMGDAGPALVAYVIPAGHAPLTSTALREALAQVLPDYMIPGFFVAIADIPTRASGKIDVEALPAPDAHNLLPDVQAAAHGHAPGNAVQQQVSALVASMLGRPTIGADENFFMVGGHSMLGVELVAKIRDAFGVRLTLRQLFKAPTVAALAAEISQPTAQP